MKFYTIFKRANLIVLLSFLCAAVSAQEHTGAFPRNFTSNAANQASKTQSITTTSLPFFDDFSYAVKTNYTDPNRWLDSNVYINSEFPLAPPSIGVATFDGLNKYGYPYGLLAGPNPNSADTLTSVKINLQTKGGGGPYTISDSLYLSFYYQSQGRGNYPEAGDSLCLDFKKPNQDRWVKVWGRRGYNTYPPDSNFYRVMIPIRDTAYLDSAFQFRFRNKATITGNNDHWHIDYVYLNELRNKNDTTINDITFVYKSTPFLKNYYTMPYRQYNPLEMATSFKNYFRNNYSVNQSPNYKFNVYDNNNALVAAEAYGNFNNPGIAPFANNGYFTGMPQSNPSLTITPFPTAFTAPAIYKIEHIVRNGSGDAVPENDTLIQYQKFTNYYAYDDGSPEAAYDLTQYGSKTALRFTLNVQDTLRAVNILFLPVQNGSATQQSSFRLMVWAGNSGTPGALIHKDSTMYPVYTTGMYNNRPTYALSSCLPLGPGSYFIGLQQVTNMGLSIGLDRNTDRRNALYNDVGAGWVQSNYQGSLMINPIMMGCSEALVGVKEHELKPNQLSIYPNPAQNSLTIRANANLENATVAILSSIGQMVYADVFQNEQSIDISNLSNGIYFVYINSKDHNVSPKKLIISR